MSLPRNSGPGVLGPDRQAIQCNYAAGTKACAKGARAYVRFTNPGSDNDRLQVLARSRSGRWIRKWEDIRLLHGFRVTTIPPQHPLHGRLGVTWSPQETAAELNEARERHLARRTRPLPQDGSPGALVETASSAPLFPDGMGPLIEEILRPTSPAEQHGPPWLHTFTASTTHDRELCCTQDELEPCECDCHPTQPAMTVTAGRARPARWAYTVRTSSGSYLSWTEEDIFDVPEPPRPFASFAAWQPAIAPGLSPKTTVDVGNALAEALRGRVGTVPLMIRFPRRAGVCGHCGAWISQHQRAFAGRADLCHTGTLPPEASPPDCYRLVTVYGHEPNGSCCRSAGGPRPGPVGDPSQPEAFAEPETPPRNTTCYGIDWDRRTDTRPPAPTVFLPITPQRAPFWTKARSRCSKPPAPPGAVTDTDEENPYAP